MNLGVLRKKEKKVWVWYAYCSESKEILAIIWESRIKIESETCSKDYEELA
ncbi:MAG: hypothetical protein NZ516_05125 [Raineya sp.]|nr:hypothetical protein [Raineya sp.]